jgi:NADH:ubiquinone oxidoreductase subunit 3 (subunit A)
MNTLLMQPPIVFAIVLLAAIALSLGLRKLAFKPKNVPEGLTKPYACGEDVNSHMARPNYSQFFPFAFYFTILHVVALMVATIPATTAQSITIAGLYVLGAIIGLLVLYRR